MRVTESHYYGTLTREKVSTGFLINKPYEQVFDQIVVSTSFTTPTDDRQSRNTTVALIYDGIASNVEITIKRQNGNNSTEISITPRHPQWDSCKPQVQEASRIIQSLFS